MLVLRLKQDSEVMINDDIKIVIKGINGNQVTIGFLADKKHRIVRGDQICEETNMRWDSMVKSAVNSGGFDG